MKMPHGRVVAAGRLLLEALFPGRCILCGCWLDPLRDHGEAVCCRCRESFVVDASPRCAACGIMLVSEQGTCMRCRGVERALEGSFALFPDRGAPRTVLHALKFEKRTRLAPLVAGWVARELEDRYPGIPVVPVPPRPGRRDPDAVERICRQLETGHRVTVMRLLARSGGEEQKSLDYEERARNLRGRITVAAPGAGVPERAILFDDVFTTGATLDACARALRTAGVVEVRGLTFLIEE